MQQPGMTGHGMQPGMQQSQQQPQQQSGMSHSGMPPAGASAPNTPAKPTLSASDDPVLELIKQSGLVNDAQIEEAKKMRQKIGGELVSMLVAQGAIKRCVKDAAVKCCSLIEKGTLKQDYAYTVVKLCQSKDIKYEDALEELGWRLG